MKEVSDQFAAEDFVVLPNDFFDEDISMELRREAVMLVSQFRSEKDLLVSQSGNTRRKLATVGRDTIYQHAGAIRRVFESDILLENLSDIARERVYRVPYAPEEYIITSLSERGDVHGWHWDDYSFALVHIAEAPDPIHGGRLEMLSRLSRDNLDPGASIRHGLRNRRTVSLHLEKGQTYFMRTNTTLHRVAPLTDNSVRTAIVFAFASEPELTSSLIDHTSMEQLFP